jgi:hypothetical protein
VKAPPLRHVHVSHSEADLEVGGRPLEEAIERETPLQTEAARRAGVPGEHALHVGGHECGVLGRRRGTERAQTKQSAKAAHPEQSREDGDENPDPRHQKDLPERGAR